MDMNKKILLMEKKLKTNQKVKINLKTRMGCVSYLRKKLNQHLPKPNPRHCILGCKQRTHYYSFPEEWEACMLWFKELLLRDIPTSRDGLYLCGKHFSPQQRTEDGDSLLPSAIPDRNIPGKELLPKAKTQDLKVEDKNDSTTSNRPKIITSRISKCFLKCQQYTSLHRFPADPTSRKNWLTILNIPENKKLKQRECLCNNHFSSGMKTPRKILPNAVPDLCLPSQCLFIDEFESEGVGEPTPDAPAKELKTESTDPLNSDSSTNQSVQNTGSTLECALIDDLYEEYLEEMSPDDHESIEEITPDDPENIEEITIGDPKCVEEIIPDDPEGIEEITPDPENIEEMAISNTKSVVDIECIEIMPDGPENIEEILPNDPKNEEMTTDDPEELAPNDPENTEEKTSNDSEPTDEMTTDDPVPTEKMTANDPENTEEKTPYDSEPTHEMTTDDPEPTEEMTTDEPEPTEELTLNDHDFTLEVTPDDPESVEEIIPDEPKNIYTNDVQPENQQEIEMKQSPQSLIFDEFDPDDITEIIPDAPEAISKNELQTTNCIQKGTILPVPIKLLISECDQQKSDPNRTSNCVLIEQSDPDDIIELTSEPENAFEPPTEAAYTPEQSTTAPVQIKPSLPKKQVKRHPKSYYKNLSNKPELRSIPQYIFVETVFMNKNEPAPKQFEYRKFTIDKKAPKRDRAVQIENEADQAVPTASIGVSADEDWNTDSEDLNIFEENINSEKQSFNHYVYPSKTKDLFECLKCGEISSNLESSQKHLALHSDIPVLCFYCGRFFSDGIRLKSHERHEHILKTKLLHRCPMMACTKAFHSQKNLDEHLKTHTERTKHSCNNCGRLFYSTLKLRCHMFACRPRYRKPKIIY